MAVMSKTHTHYPRAIIAQTATSRGQNAQSATSRGLKATATSRGLIAQKYIQSSPIRGKIA